MHRRKKAVVVLVLVGFFVSLTSSALYALTLLSEEKALEKVFGKDIKVATETKELEGKQLEEIKKRLGGSLVYYQKGSKSTKVVAKTKIDFQFATKDNKKIGVAIIGAEPGKWGPVKFIIALNLDGSVKRVEVMSYKEKRGRPIARRSFMKQFEKKTTKSTLKVRKDIRGISGATISSRCATFAVKKALVLYEELYLKPRADDAD